MDLISLTDDENTHNANTYKETFVLPPNNGGLQSIGQLPIYAVALFSSAIIILASIQASLFTAPQYYPTTVVHDACTGVSTTTQLPIVWPYLLVPKPGEHLERAVLVVRTHSTSPVVVPFYWFQSDSTWESASSSTSLAHYEVMYNSNPIGACTSQTACYECDAHNIISINPTTLTGFTGIRVFVGGRTGYIYGNGFFQMFDTTNFEVHDVASGNITFSGISPPTTCALIEITQGTGKITYGNRQVSAVLRHIPTVCAH